MALPNSNFDQISAITEKYFVPKLVDNIFDSNVTLKMLEKKCKMKVSGGTSINIPLNYALTSASGWYSKAETLDITDNDIITGAQYNWKQFYVSVVVNGYDEMVNSGPQAVLDIVKSKMKVAEKTARDQMGTMIYNSGTDAKAPAGLRQILSTSNTVGGISQANYSWWQAQVDSTSTTLTISALQTMFNLCSIDNDTPDIITATRSNYNRYYNLLQPQQRFMSEEMAKGGFTSLMFNGVPFTIDAKVPANGIFFLNSNYLHYIVHPQRDFKFEPFVKPINQDAKVAKILFMGGFGSSNNRMHGYMSAVAA